MIPEFHHRFAVIYKDRGQAQMLRVSAETHFIYFLNTQDEEEAKRMWIPWSNVNHVQFRKDVILVDMGKSNLHVVYPEDYEIPVERKQLKRLKAKRDEAPKA